MESLELITLQALQKDLELKISEKEIEIWKMKSELGNAKSAILDYKKKKFFETYDLSTQEVFQSYVERLVSCCYQGGEGYSWWLSTKYMPTYCHCVIEPKKYKEAQPTEIECEAYNIIYGKEMEVTKQTHYERWGN